MGMITDWVSFITDAWNMHTVQRYHHALYNNDMERPKAIFTPLHPSTFCDNLLLHHQPDLSNFAALS